MLFGRYALTLALDGDAVLPEYKGSTLRGIFGHSLKKVVCALKREECTDCLLREKCLYFRVFEHGTSGLSAPSARDGEPNDANSHSRKRTSSPPKPFVIEPPADAATRYARGDTLDFTLLLFGDANDYLAYFIHAFLEMGNLGIGKKIDGRRPTFHLAQATSEGRIVYDAAARKICKGPFTRDLSLAACAGDIPDNPSEITVRLLTPLRVKYENRLKADLPFHILVRAMLRRISALEEACGEGEPALDYRGLVKRAEAIACVASRVRWFDWKRYSNRQDQSMLMGGMIGEATYAGDLAAFLPLLRYSEQVHLGKETTFGLGKIGLSA